MGVVGTLLKNRRAGEARLAWNLPALSGPQTLTVTSAAFADGAPIPVEHADKRVGGGSVSPPLSWADVPPGTAELLLVIEDIDAPTSAPFVHCVAVISREVTSLAPGALDAERPAQGVRVFRSGMGRGYLGPGPIKGHGPHRYVFQVFALSGPALADAPAAERAKPRELLGAIAGPVLARGRLTGVYER